MAGSETGSDVDDEAVSVIAVDVVQPPAQEEILDDRVHDDLPDDPAKDLAPLVAATAEINPSEAQAVSTMLASTTGDLIGKVLSAK